MRSDQRTRPLFSGERLTGPLPRPGKLDATSRLGLFVRVGEMTWAKERLSDGTPGWRGACVCGHRMHTGFSRLKPSALLCTCGRWHRVP